MNDLKLLKTLVLLADWTDRDQKCKFCKQNMVTNFQDDDCLLIEARSRGLIDQDDLLASGDFDDGEPLTKWGKAWRQRRDSEERTP